MATGKPMFVFVPGAWHGTEAFDTIGELLTSKGYEHKPVANPSTGASAPDDHGLHTDIAHTHNVLKELVDEGKQIIVVTHSYGGLVGAGAVEGLEHASRAAAGKKGGIIMLVYMSAFALPKGNSLLGGLGGNWLPWMKADKGDGYCWSDTPEIVFYNDMSTEEQQKWIARLAPQPLKCYTQNATYDAWNHVPCTYIFCEKDQAIPVQVQEMFAKTLGEHTQFRCDSSHSPFLSVPEQLLEGLELAAKVGVEKSGVVVVN